MTFTGNFERFQYLKFETNFTGVSFLVESTKIVNKTLPCKTALSEANIKTNRVRSTKWTYHKEWSFANN